MEDQFGNSRKPGRTAGCVWTEMKGDAGSVERWRRGQWCKGRHGNSVANFTATGPGRQCELVKHGGGAGSWRAPGWITLLWLVDSGFLAVQTVVGIFLFCGVPLRFSGGQTKQVSQSDMVSGLPVCCIESVDMTAKILLCHAQHTDVFLAQMWPRVANRWTRPGSQFWGASWGSWFVTAWSKRKKCPFTLNFLWQEVTLNWVPRSRSSNIKWSTERRVWILGGMGTRERDLGWQQVWICHLSQGELGGRHHKALEEADAGQRVQSHPTYPR